MDEVPLKNISVHCIQLKVPRAQYAHVKRVSRRIGIVSKVNVILLALERGLVVLEKQLSKDVPP